MIFVMPFKKLFLHLEFQLMTLNGAGMIFKQIYAGRFLKD